MNNFIDNFNNIFFLGIKGVAMANLAVVLQAMGKNVCGVDVEEEFITDKLLKKHNINVSYDFKNLPKNIDLFVYSAAHKGINNPLAKIAIKKQIRLISQAHLLGKLMNNFENKIAISGCHGKTTTSSLLSYALNKLNQNPSYIVGVPFFKDSFGNDYDGGSYQDKKYFIVEADEYGVNPPVDKTPKFLKLNPDWIICTNIDFDHPDVYKNIEKTKEAFLKFFDNKKLIINIDDKNLIAVYKKIKNKKNVLTYGFSKLANYQIINYRINEENCQFEIKFKKESTFISEKFTISLFGKHNISNATAVIVQLLNLGFSLDKIKKSIKDFTGAKRRMELISKGDFYLLDDYAHHPQEIRATLDAAKARFKDKRIVVIFQPHTYSRTISLLKEFKKALEIADLGFVLPIFASARENKNQYQISSSDIVKNSKKLFFCNDEKDLINKLKKHLKKNDVIFTMGAGDVYKLKLKIKNQKLKVD
ncbi:MAG: UDP-N-acetylmuramate--L-alanine ligase [Candidatus Microgenomates bacterium]